MGCPGSSKGGSGRFEKFLSGGLKSRVNSPTVGSCIELLATFRPDWPTRQYSVDNSVDHPNPFIPFVMRLTGMRMGVHNSNT